MHVPIYEARRQHQSKRVHLLLLAFTGLSVYLLLAPAERAAASTPAFPRSAARTTPTPAFIPLGHLPLHDLNQVPYSGAAAISGDGTTIVGRGNSDNYRSACWRWTEAEGMVEIGNFPDANSSQGCISYDTSRNGTTIVGRAVHPGKGEAFVWTQSNGFLGLGDLGNPLDDTSEAFRISADGRVVVGEASDANRRDMAFRWTPEGGMVGLGFLTTSVPSSTAYGLSADGSIVVGRSGPRAFRWTQETGMVDIGDLPGGSAVAEARGVSGDGRVITGWSQSSLGAELFRWTAENGMIALGDLPGGSVLAQTYGGISYDGNVIVGYGSTTAGERAFVWESGRGLRDLRSTLVNDFGVNVSGYTLRQAWDVSDDGTRIVGWADGPNGVEAFLAIIPEPASLSLLLLAGGAAFVRSRQRKQSGR